MVRLDKEDAELLLKGKTPREIYEIVRDRVSKAPGASINDFFETVERLTECAEDLRIQRVQLLRTVERDPGDPVTLFVEDRNLVRIVLHERQHLPPLDVKTCAAVRA